MYTRLTHIFIIAIAVLCLPALTRADSIKSKIAVLDFELSGDTFPLEGLGPMVAEWFVTSLVKDGRFDVIERALLQKILNEQKLGASGLLDDSSVSKIGKILGVKIIISGSVLNLGKMLEINARIINVEDGTIIAAENIKSPSGVDLQKAVENLTGQIVKAFPLTGYVVKKDQNTVMIDLGIGAGVQPGMEFVVFKEGKAINHPKTGEIIDIEQIHTGRIKVSQVHDNVAEAGILKEEADGIEYGHLVSSVQSKKAALPRPAATTDTTPKNSGEDGVKLVDSPVYDEPQKHTLTGNQAEGNAKNKAKNLDRSQSRTPAETKKQLIASTPGCQELLKSWQLGDSSIMQRYLKECSK